MTAPVKEPPASVRPTSFFTIPSNASCHDGVTTGGVLPGAVLTMSRWMTTLGALACAAIVVGVLALHFGAQPIAFGEIVRLLIGAVAMGAGTDDVADVTRTILEQVRLPRVLLGFLVGCSLASVGVALQALLRNPLADPYVLGVSSGAALGAAVGVLLGVGTTFLAAAALPACGFAGALMALVVVYRMATDYDRLPIHSLLLAGVILNAIFTALIMFITSIMDPNRAYGMMAWLMGAITAPTYGHLLGLSVYLGIGLFLLLSQMRVLNVLALGEDSARALGIDTERTKRVLFVLAALITGAVVSISGMIGFIGMVVPHAVRLIVGADHRLLLPASALVGGTFLMGADTVARTLLSPAEIPVGIITALTGGPFFIYLLLWRKDRLA
ncbi:MAG: iron ABC transporter permease [Nitrospira sp.]|nr:iron ABC transporter permease [Nitrospira sp.]MDH4368732.1 iron ABC transporter permease [Nitrospira sp.]MDH5497979.1 iron ABC transporter permease [Nitrospira sp.]MDH5726479.1 iron ABC transporter permease [Nitrospira sp.]